MARGDWLEKWWLQMQIYTRDYSFVVSGVKNMPISDGKMLHKVDPALRHFILLGVLGMPGWQAIWML